MRKTGYSWVEVPFKVEDGTVTRVDVTLRTGEAAGRGSNLVSTGAIWTVTLGFLSLQLSDK